LYAIKDDDRDVVRMYALHRMLRAEVGLATAYQAPGFDLQRQIDSGHADFGRGEVVELALRARGYVADLLRDCPLNDTQQIDDELERSLCEVSVRATLPATGQLLRWLLGCGDTMEVIAPQELRQVLPVQVMKVAPLYGHSTADMETIPT